METTTEEVATMVEQAVVVPETTTAARHSTGSPDWGTSMLLRSFASEVLRAAARCGAAIDLDYASNAYWQQHWPHGVAPANFLDGSPGRDVRQKHERRAALGTHFQCGSGFLNAPGTEGGRMVQQCWSAFDDDHLSGWLDSGCWTGFSVEQFASLQGVSKRNPLTRDPRILTIVPSRRVRYLLEPEAMIALIEKKRERYKTDDKKSAACDRKIEQLRNRTDDRPIQGDAPPHASFITFLLAEDAVTRAAQREAMRLFLEAQSAVPTSTLQEVAVIGEGA